MERTPMFDAKHHIVEDLLTDTPGARKTTRCL